MFKRRNDSVSAPRRLPACLLVYLALTLSATSHARLLFLEDPLRSLPVLEPDRHRLELGSEYFGARGWTGLRHSFRYAGTRGEAMGWSVTLPWLYTSSIDTGESGRDNLRGGIFAYPPGLPRGRFGAAAEIWFPFSEDRLYPLQQRRAFARATLMSAFEGAGLDLRVSASYRWELQGLGPEVEGAKWPNRYLLQLRAGRPLGRAWELFAAGGVSVSEDAASWGRIESGLSVAWSDLWRAELSAETTLGNQGDPDLYDYRISLRFSRDLLRELEDPEEEGEGREEGGEGSPAGVPARGPAGSEEEPQASPPGGARGNESSEPARPGVDDEPGAGS